MRPFGPGEVVADKFCIVRLLGEGGMGVVYEAEHMRLQKRVALKILSHAQKGDNLERFEREARAMAALSSPYVVRVIDIDRMPWGAPYIEMELLQGRSLREELDLRGSMQEGEVTYWLSHVTAALVEAHGVGIVHRDLKPDNIMLVDTPAGRIAKVVDFGVARFLRDARLTQSGVAVGTLSYMAPEQLIGESDVDHRADLWAVGVVAYRMLTGRLPHKNEPDQVALMHRILADRPLPPASVVPGISPALSDLVCRLLEKDRARRPGSAAEILPCLHSIRCEPAPHEGSGPTLHQPPSVAHIAAAPTRSGERRNVAPPERSILYAPTVRQPPPGTQPSSSAPVILAAVVGLAVATGAAVGGFTVYRRRAAASASGGVGEASVRAPSASVTAGVTVEPSTPPTAAEPPSNQAAASVPRVPSAMGRPPSSSPPAVAVDASAAAPAASCLASTGPRPFASCGGQCVLVSNDTNCGACGAVCMAPTHCLMRADEKWSCSTCPANRTYCSPFCVDTALSIAHCGACGHPCKAGELCKAGVCAKFAR